MRTFDLYPVIDLTVAHTDLKITTVRPLKFLQVWCDGVLDGISVKFHTQSDPELSFSQIAIIPTPENPDTIYITNDVRPGRSALILYFVHSDDPLNLTLGGWGITAEELAVRYGSIAAFDRRGDIVFSTQNKKILSDPLYITASTIGHGSLSSIVAKSNQRSIKLVTAAVAGDFVALFSLLPYSNQSRHGIEASLYNGTAADWEWRVSIVIYTGATRYQGTLIYDKATTTLSISVGTVPTVVVLDAALDLTANVFKQFKLVIDPTTNKYVRALVDSNSYDIKDYDLESAASVTAAAINTYIRLTSTLVAGAVETGYVDDMIITRNEP